MAFGNFQDTTIALGFSSTLRIATNGFSASIPAAACSRIPFTLPLTPHCNIPFLHSHSVRSNAHDHHRNPVEDTKYGQTQTPLMTNPASSSRGLRSFLWCIEWMSSEPPMERPFRMILGTVALPVRRVRYVLRSWVSSGGDTGSGFMLQGQGALLTSEISLDNKWFRFDVESLQ